MAVPYDSGHLRQRTEALRTALSAAEAAAPAMNAIRNAIDSVKVPPIVVDFVAEVACDVGVPDFQAISDSVARELLDISMPTREKAAAVPAVALGVAGLGALDGFSQMADSWHAPTAAAAFAGAAVLIPQHVVDPPTTMFAEIARELASHSLCPPDQLTPVAAAVDTARIAPWITVGEVGAAHFASVAAELEGFGAFPRLGADLGALVPRIDLGAVAEVRRVVNLLPDLSGIAVGIAPDFSGIRAMLDSLPSAVSAFAEEHERIAMLFDGWRRLGGMGHQLAQHAYLAALEARDAVVAGDKAALERFVRRWLKVKNRRKTTLDAAAAALLEDSWLDADDDEVIPVLNKLHSTHIRYGKFLGDTEIEGSFILSLDQPGQRLDGDTGPLLDTIAARPGKNAGIDVAELDRRDLQIAFTMLDDDERKLALARSNTANWQQAAAVCGIDQGTCEKLRRSIRRKGVQARQRAANELTTLRSA